jgi:S1-C subfamily serine protease
MKGSNWRCLAALISAFCGLVPAVGQEAAWSATFHDKERQATSAVFAVADGRHLVAVALSGTDAAGGRLKLAGRELPADVFVDPVSRLVLFRIAGAPAAALPLLAAAPAAGGTEFRHGVAGRGVITGWRKQIGDKILPLFLLTVEYAGVPPPPGTALVNEAGAVMAVAHESTGPQAGYALPVEVVRHVLESVQASGRVAKGWLGLRLQPAAAAPRVTGVDAGSPSARAGVRAGDLLLQVDSRRLGEYADAVNAFYFLRPGTPALLRIQRDGEQLTLSVTPAERARR